MKVEFHPTFAGQYVQLCQDEDAAEIAGEITMLLDALEQHGHDIEGEATDDPSHPIVTSRFQLFALRRTPPTTYTPYADEPPIIRIPYVWFIDTESGEEAIETLLIPSWQHHHPNHRAMTRRTR